MLHARVGTFLFCLFIVACSRSGKPGGGSSDMGGGAITTLEIAPATATIALMPGAQSGSYSGTTAFTARARQPDGTMRDVTATATWSASDPSLHVDSGGHATATLVGTYTVSAMLSGQTATATVNVTLAASTPLGGFNGDPGKLDGTPGAGAPTIVYPLAGSLFPVNIAPVEIHVRKSDASQTIARISFTVGSTLSFKFYATCQPSPNAAQFPDACIVPVSGAYNAELAAASAGADVVLQARLAAADGSHLGESAPVSLAWSTMPLSGGLYYWTTAGKSDTTFNTAVARYDFSGDASAPQIWLSSAQAPAVPQGQTQCIGCHALSRDGHKLAFSLGGSAPGYFALYDVATRTVTTQNMSDKYVDMTTFSPDGSEMVNMSWGKLTLRTADANATVVSDNLFASDVKEPMSHPFWSPDGSALAFVSWVPGMYGAVAGQQITGDMVQGAEIWIAPSDGQKFTGAPKLLVPRSPLDGSGNATYSSYYPAISDDGAWVVFDRSSCSGPADANASDWGAGACDGYNDFSAQLMLVPASGGAPVALAKANGTQTWTNSWPRWSPDHGTFRGKKLYWIAFSSRRDYGLGLQGSTDGTTKPQMWFTAVAVDSTGTGQDPSFAPVWLPGQDPDLTGPRGNHTPAWTSVALPIP